MARNGSGTYTVPNSFTSGTAITASDHNENWADIGSEITNSVAADGQTSMTGALKGAAGSVSAPSISFASDADSGMYRIGADNIGIAVGGVKIVDVASTGATVAGAIDATVIKQGSYRLVPAGVLAPYAGASAPDGWLLCYGQAVSRTTYADLFTAISTTYGAGDSSTTFNLPDLRGRVVAGQDDMGGSSANRLTGQTGGLDGDTLGATGGTETHTLSLTEAPAHDHGGVTGTTKPDLVLTGVGGGANVPTTPNTSLNGGSTVVQLNGQSAGASDIGVSTHTHTITSAGGGGAHNNVQPTIVLNYIIKT